MDHVALSPHGARRGGFRCAELALRNPVSARAGPEGCSAGGDAGRRGVAGGLVEALFRWTTYGPSGLAASRHARRRPIEPFSPGVVVRGPGRRGRKPFGVVGADRSCARRDVHSALERCISPSRCAVRSARSSAKCTSRRPGAGRAGPEAGVIAEVAIRAGARGVELSESVAKARIEPGCQNRIVDIPRFFSPPTPEGYSVGSWWRSPVRTIRVRLDHGGPTVVPGGGVRVSASGAQRCRAPWSARSSLNPRARHSGRRARGLSDDLAG